MAPACQACMNALWPLPWAHLSLCVCGGGGHSMPVTLPAQLTGVCADAASALTGPCRREMGQEAAVQREEVRRLVDGQIARAVGVVDRTLQLSNASGLASYLLGGGGGAGGPTLVAKGFKEEGAGERGGAHVSASLLWCVRGWVVAICVAGLGALHGLDAWDEAHQENAQFLPQIQPTRPHPTPLLPPARRCSRLAEGPYARALLLAGFKFPSTAGKLPRLCSGARCRPGDDAGGHCCGGGRGGGSEEVGRGGGRGVAKRRGGGQCCTVSKG